MKAGEEGDNRGWNGQMASLTQWTWVWVNSGSCRWTGRPGVLQSMGVTKSQTRLSHWTELKTPPYDEENWCVVGDWGAEWGRKKNERIWNLLHCMWLSNLLIWLLFQISIYLFSHLYKTSVTLTKCQDYSKSFCKC